MAKIRISTGLHNLANETLTADLAAALFKKGWHDNLAPIEMDRYKEVAIHWMSTGHTVEGKQLQRKIAAAYGPGNYPKSVTPPREAGENCAAYARRVLVGGTRCENYEYIKTRRTDGNPDRRYRKYDRKGTDRPMSHTDWYQALRSDGWTIEVLGWHKDVQSLPTFTQVVKEFKRKHGVHLTDAIVFSRNHAWAVVDGKAVDTLNPVRRKVMAIAYRS